jgi:hypothetical protein
LVSELNSLKKSLPLGETMLKAGEEIEVLPPKLDDDDNTIVVKKASSREPPRHQVWRIS